MKRIPSILVKTWLDIHYFFKRNDEVRSLIPFNKIQYHFSSINPAQNYIEDTILIELNIYNVFYNKIAL